MVQFPSLPPPALWIQAGVRAHYHALVSSFGDPRIKGWSAPPRGLSQPPTSFIGSWRQGIHRVPLFSWSERTRVCRYGVFKVRADCVRPTEKAAHWSTPAGRGLSKLNSVTRPEAGAPGATR